MTDQEREFVNGFLAKNFDFAVEIVDANSKTRKLAMDLWHRSQGTLRKITIKHERDLCEAEFAGKGITSAEAYAKAVKNGFINPCSLILKLEDFISVSEQKKALKNNPDTIKVGDKILMIRYDRDPLGFYARTEVPEELIYETETEKVVLPSGRGVVLFCKGCLAETFAGLARELKRVVDDRKKEMSIRYWSDGSLLI